MPTISTFFGIVIRMYYDDHAPPRFHAHYAEYAAQIEIETLRVLEGWLPKRVLVLVVEWALEHRPELRDDWLLNTLKTTRAEPREGFVLFVEFSDGVSGEVDLSTRLFGPMFEPLRDEALFRLVRIDEFGAPCWPNGADLAPDALHRMLSEQPATAP
jgi:hypothetical protein